MTFEFVVIVKSFSYYYVCLMREIYWSFNPNLT